MICLSQEVLSQSNPEDPKEYFYALMQELEGSYQIQMVNSRMKPMITTEMLEQIKAMQSTTSEVTFSFNETIRIVIKSKQDVQSGNKFSDDEQIIYVSE